MDESSKQLIGEVREPITCAPGRIARMDDEYVRNGVAEIFMEVEPLSGKRHVAITERRTRKDWVLSNLFERKIKFCASVESALKDRLDYLEWKENAIAEGQADLDAGRGVTTEQLRASLARQRTHRAKRKIAA